MGPAVFAVSAAQISLMINTSIASRLAEGSISWLSYADRLMEFPTAMLGVALGTILLPSLSKANVDGDKAEYSALLDWGLRLTFLLALPAAVGMATLATPLIATLFHYGKFSAEAVTMSTEPLVAYSLGLIGIILVKTLAPAFYARQDIRTPVKIAIGVLIATQLMNLVFVPYIAVAGLALSIGLGACLNASFLYWGLRKRGIYQPKPGWPTFPAPVAGAGRDGRRGRLWRRTHRLDCHAGAPVAARRRAGPVDLRLRNSLFWRPAIGRFSLPRFQAQRLKPARLFAIQALRRRCRQVSVPARQGHQSR